ncbi:hypothetical protein AB0M46_15090 [Dactylosporangium sp. NPDC051485]|uniref:hypothetical protein n=1 Tax=Dactylosporangium sp. NPDC051485 TaxID=3154846 RepID=UPI00344A19FB
MRAAIARFSDAVLNAVAPRKVAAAKYCIGGCESFQSCPAPIGQTGAYKFKKCLTGQGWVELGCVEVNYCP